ncbi:MAG: hypothetical protein RLW62_00385, partial [Gammaproteobacteria bacterium]
MSNPPEPGKDAVGQFARRLLRGLCGTLVLLAASQPLAAREVQVAVLDDGPAERRYIPLDAVVREAGVLLEGEHTVRFPAALQRDGDWAVARIAHALDALLADPRVDVVLTSGLIATHLAAHRDVLPKPVIGMVVADPVLQA